MPDVLEILPKEPVQSKNVIVAEKTAIDEIRSDEVQEILSHVPNWMIRWGITIIFGLIGLVLFVSWMIKYPDVVSGSARITTTIPVVKLVSQSGGYIQHLYVNEGEMIEKGDVIAEIRNPISSTSIKYLDSIVKLAELQKLDTNIAFGEIQAEYNNLVKNSIEYQDLINTVYHKNELKYVDDQIKYNNGLAWIASKEIDLIETELLLAEDKYSSNKNLYEKGYISKHEFYERQQELNRQKKELNGQKKTQIQFKMAASNSLKQKNELIKNYELKKRTLESVIEANRKSINSYIENWNQNYLVRAPYDGKVSYLGAISNNQYVNAQKELFAVIPNENNYVAEIKLPIIGSGKIQKGQKVRVKLDNYPYQQFGQLLGEIISISELSNEGNYLVKVSLPGNLQTTYNKELKYLPEMEGVAEIVTDDLRVIERVFNNFRKVIDK